MRRIATAARRKANSAPIRTCVGCRGRFPQAALVRFVRSGAGWPVDAARVRAPGRGAYLCSQRCAEGVSKNKRYPGLAATARCVDWTARDLCADAAGVYDSAGLRTRSRRKRGTSTAA